jgi:hypothetical protein
VPNHISETKPVTPHHLSRSGDRLVWWRNRSANIDLLNPSRSVQLKVRLRRVHAHTLLAKEVDQKRAGLVVPLRESSLVVLVPLHVLNVLIKEIRRVHRAALGFRVELRAEDGARVVDHALVGLVVEVGEVLPPLAAESRGIDSVSVVLRRDVAFAGGEVEGGNVVRAVAVLELDGLGAGGKGDELVAHAYAHDGDLGRLEQLAEVVDGRRAMGGITWAVRVEDTVKVVGDLVDGVVEGEAGDAGATGHEAAKDVLLDTAVDESNVHVAEGRADVEGCFSGHTADEVDSLGVDVCLIFVGIVLLTNGDTSQRGTLLAEVCHNLTGVDARDGWNTLTSTPFSKGLDGSPVAVLESIVLHNDARRLNVGRLEVSEQAVLIAGGRGHAVVADQRLGEDEDLAAVRGVRHGLGVSHERRGEDCLARDVGFGAERLAGEDGAILEIVSRWLPSLWLEDAP